MSEPVEVVVPGVPKGVEQMAFSIGTLVRDHTQYNEMCDTFFRSGFATNDCEYLFIDNTGDEQTSAYRGLNAILNAARGTHVILCHQDVRIIYDSRADLELRLRELGQLDSKWGVAGNVGGTGPSTRAIRVSDPHGDDQRAGGFPSKAISLDENFLVLRKDARLGFSDDLSGFHFYGTDICLHAEMRGYAAYIIDFHLRHLSGGNVHGDFRDAQVDFEQKWSRALRERNLQTSCCQLHLKG